MRRHDDGNGGHETRVALWPVARDHEAQRAAGVPAHAMAAEGKTTEAGRHSAPAATAGPVAQLRQTIAAAACDVINLGQANLNGDFMRASWAQASIARFMDQSAVLLAMARSAGGDLETQILALVERARAALDSAPKISPAARAAAQRGDYSRWKADLAPWRAKASPEPKPETGERGPVPILHLGPGPDPRGAGPPSDTAESHLVDEEHGVAARGTQGAGGRLPHLETIQKSFGRHDVSSVRAHVGGEAASASQSLGAQAYAYGNAVAFASAPDLHTAAHEAAHVVQQRGGVQLKGGVGQANDVYERHADAVADRVVAGHSAESLLAEAPAAPAATTGSAAIQRKEVGKVSEISGVQDWTRHDRETNSARWQAACLHNLQAVDSSQYVKVVERRDFYKWFYEYSVSLGLKTRWALAASLVADAAHQIADMDEHHAHANSGLGIANVELQGAMREGNQVIFDNVLPKLKQLIEHPEMIQGGNDPLGKAALEWDKRTLSEEQALVQPMYARMSPETVGQLNYIARKKRFAGIGATMTGDDKIAKGPHNNEGCIPAFDQPDIQNVDHRWRYGMELGNQFTPGGTGYNPAVDTRPPEPAGYRDGTEFAKVDTRQHLHELDAWLNPNRISRGAGNDLQPILAGLTPREKAVVLSDQSADGWSYSKQFAQFSMSEAQVRQALPSEPAEAVSAFISRYAAEYQRVQVHLRNLQTPPWWL